MRRTMTERNIDMDPAHIRLEREHVEEGRAGGVVTALEVLPPQRVKIYPLGQAGRTSQTTGEGGTVQFNRWGLLARWDADIRKGDEFSRLGRRYRVDTTRRATYMGEVVSVQCELEELE